MSFGTEFVLSEVLDFAVENPLFVGLVALVSFYVLLEVAGYGIICHCLYERRVKKLDDDLGRVRELQAQLGVLRTVRSTRKGDTSNETEVAGEERSKKETKGSADGNTDEAASTSTTAINDDSEGTDRSSESAKNMATEKKEIPGQPASNVYESVKDAWTWGRHETPFSPLLGLAEGLTVSTVGWFGTDMKGIDDALKPHVAGLDGHVANILGLDKKPNTEADNNDKE